MTDRDHDLIVYGATGFTGGLVARYLADHAADGLRVALGGRDRRALERSRATLPARASGWPLVEAASDDPASLARMAASTRAVLTTVGPYARLGMPLVSACVEERTDYVDLTGEVPFIRACIDRYQAPAVEQGVRLVNTCGVISGPIDLAVWDLARRVAADGAGELTDVIGLVTHGDSQRSGGTSASTLEGLAAARTDPSVRELLTDPYSLSPDRPGEPDLGPQPDRSGFDFDERLGTWLGPFWYERVNTRIVRRTNALLGYSYGRRFRYREAVALGTGRDALLRRVRMTAELAWVPLALNPRLGGAVESVLRRLWPQPGSGPDETARRGNSLTADVIGTTTSGATYGEHLDVAMDPYDATAVVMGEMGLSLVLDRDHVPRLTGLLTPAAAGQGALLERLRARGLTIEGSSRY